jgi:tripartite-type tricarboxylate transporter receptor subunit TctC
MWPRAIVLIVSLLAQASLTAAWAQAFPTPGRAITIIVGFPAGGGHDVMARGLAQELTKLLATTVMVENRPGAGGGLSVQVVARADPDGHTLLFNSLSELNARQAAGAKVPYDLERDLTPISLVGVTPIALVVHSSVPAKTLAEFKAYIKTNPDAVYGSPGVGTLMHFAGEALKYKADLPIRHLAYRGGATLANDLAGGHVLVGMSGLPPLVPLLQAGTVRLIATSTPGRSKLTPDVESFGEGGIEGVDIANYVGLAAPKNTPLAILKKLEEATLVATKAPELHEAFRRSYSSVIGSTTAEYLAFIDKERERQLELIRATGFKINE